MAVSYLSGTGYQTALGSCVSDPTIGDGSTSTGPDQSGATNGNTSYTGIVSLGSTQTVTGVEVIAGWEGAFNYIVEYSVGGSTWTLYSSGTQSSHSGTFSTATFFPAAPDLPPDAAYVRVSVKDTASGGHDCRVSIREIVVSAMGGSGGTDYTENTTLVKVGLKPSDIDVLAGADSATSKLGLKPSGTDSQTLGGGGNAYADTGQANIGLKPSAVDVRAAVDSTVVNLGLMVSGDDVQRNALIPAHWYDVGQASLGLKPSGIDITALVDAQISNLGLRASAIDTGTQHDSGTGKIGVKPSVFDAQGYFDLPVTVKVGLKPSASDISVMPAEAVISKIGLKPSAIDVTAVSDASAAKVGLRPSAVDTGAQHEAPTAKLGIASPPSASFAFTDAVPSIAKVGLKAIAQDTSAGTAYVEVGLAKMGLKAPDSAGEPRGYGDAPVVKIGLKPSGIETVGSHE